MTKTYVYKNISLNVYLRGPREKGIKLLNEIVIIVISYCTGRLRTSFWKISAVSLGPTALTSWQFSLVFRLFIKTWTHKSLVVNQYWLTSQLVLGPNCCLNSSRTNEFLDHEPQSTATKNMIHLAQSKCF